MKQSPKVIGALQAIGLVVYILTVAFTIQTISGLMPDKSPNPILGMVLFLTVFVTSALICGSIALGYPIVLFFNEGRKSEAMQTVAWTIVWLLAFALFFGVYLVAYSPFL